jgi:ribose transport system substrate-binding protein
MPPVLAAEPSIRTSGRQTGEKKVVKRWLWYAFVASALVAPMILSEYIRAHRSNRPKLAFIANCAADFWTIARCGTKEAARKLGVDVEFYMPALGTAAEQHRIVEDLVAKGVKGIAISPDDAANQTRVLNKIIPDSVYFITQDSDLSKGSKRICYLGTDNIKAGWAVGQLVREALPMGGRIMIYVGKMDVSNARERRQGVIAALSGIPEDEAKGPLSEEISRRPEPIEMGQYAVVGTRTDNMDKEKCYANVVDTLVKYPDVNCLVGLWCYNPPAMLGGVRRENKLGRVKLIGFDEDEVTLQGIADGAIHGTVVQNPYMFGYEAMHILQHLVINRGRLPEAMPEAVATVESANGKMFYVNRRVIKKRNDGGLFDLDVKTFADDLHKKKGQTL